MYLYYHFTVICYYDREGDSGKKYFIFFNLIVTVVNEMTGKLYAKFFPGEKAYITTGLAFSPDDTLLAIGDSGKYLSVVSTEAVNVKWTIQYRVEFPFVYLGVDLRHIYYYQMHIYLNHLK